MIYQYKVRFSRKFIDTIETKIEVSSSKEFEQSTSLKY